MPDELRQGGIDAISSHSGILEAWGDLNDLTGNVATVTIARTSADEQCMKRDGFPEDVAMDDDFGLVGHLAAIERAHQEALAQLDALARPWADLWSTPAPPTSLDAGGLSAEARPLSHGAHAAAA